MAEVAGVVAIDAHGVIVEIDPTAEQLLGYARSELVGQPLDRFVAPHAVGVTVRRADGTEVQVAVAHADARDSLHESEARYQHLVETTREGVCISNFEGVFTYVNRRLEVMLGYPAGDLVGKSLAQLVDEGTRGRVRQMIEQRQRGIAGNGELRVLHKDGHPIWIRYQASPRVEEGVFVGNLAMILDITEEKSAQEAADRLRAQLVVADRMSALGTLAAGIGHEINNPLAYVIGNLEMATEELATATREELAMLIGDALRGAERVARIVKGLKTFARASEEQRSILDLEDVLELSIGMVRNRIQQRARLVKAYGPVPRVEADEGRLSQVFINLLLNAAHAIPDGNPKAHEIRVTTSASPTGHAVIEILDTGRGIRDEDLERVFDPFAARTALDEGRGLGLAISHTIVTGLGGQIVVESELGRGSVFRVVLPPASREVTPPPPVAPAPLPTSPLRGRVMVIDDDPNVARTMARTLGEHDVTIALAGKDAIRILRNDQRFDVILCDLMMPEMTGMDIYGRLSSDHPELVARMIFITGGAFTPAAQEFLEQIPNARLTKPFETAELREAVRRMLRARSPSSTPDA